MDRDGVRTERCVRDGRGYGFGHASSTALDRFVTVRVQAVLIESITMSALEPLPVTTAPAKERVAYLDNARYWVMLLVVIGHSLTQFTDMDSARGVYVWIYSFHMPFFILISGYTARRYVGDARQVRRIVSTLVVPYLMVETTMQLITRHYVGEPDPLMILSPQWLAWFMAALFVWRLTTPIWRALKYPITTSIVISLLVGLIEVPNVLALPKILGFLPFYVVGLHMSRERFERLAAPRDPCASVVAARLGALICYVYSQELDDRLAAVEAALRRGPAQRHRDRGHHPAGRAAGDRLPADVRGAVARPPRRSWTTASRRAYVLLLPDARLRHLVPRSCQFEVFDRIDQYGVVAVIGCIIGAHGAREPADDQARGHAVPPGLRAEAHVVVSVGGEVRSTTAAAPEETAPPPPTATTH